MSSRTDILNQTRAPARSSWLRSTALALVFTAAGGGAVWYAMTLPERRQAELLETSQSAPLEPDTGPGAIVPQLEGLPEPPPQEPEPDPIVDEDPELAQLRAENARLADELEASAKEAAERRRAFEERLDEIERDGEMRLAELEAEFLRREADAQAERDARLAADEADAERRRMFEEERARQQEALSQRMQSPPVVGKTGPEAFDSGTVGAEREAMSGEREFLIANAAATETRRASIMANPGNTVAQGTVIEAALEVAINSDLQGQISAIVSRDVWSMDMTRVLIPRGSKLFGTYQSELGQTQRRVLVAWTRLTTTDGQTVSLSAFGSDRLGRSGMASEIDRHFASRFGSAALVSIIGGLPALIAEKSGNGSETYRDVAEDVGDGFSGAVGQVMQDYLSQKPTILVHQGENVSIRVDSDLEFY